MTDIPKRGARKHPGYKMLNRLLRHKIPQAMDSYGLEAQAQMLRQQPEIKNEESAYVATQAIAAMAIGYSKGLTVMLDKMPPELQADVLAAMPPVEEVMASLEGAD